MTKKGRITAAEARKMIEVLHAEGSRISRDQALFLEPERLASTNARPSLVARLRDDVATIEQHQKGH